MQENRSIFLCIALNYKQIVPLWREVFVSKGYLDSLYSVSNSIGTYMSILSSIAARSFTEVVV